MLLLVMMNIINWGLKDISSIVLNTLNKLFHLILTTSRGRYIIMYNLPVRKLRDVKVT